MCKRGLCCRPVSVRPSVRLFCHVRVLYPDTEDVVRLLSRPGSLIILVFFCLTLSADIQFQGKLHQRGR